MQRTLAPWMVDIDTPCLPSRPAPPCSISDMAWCSRKVLSALSRSARGGGGMRAAAPPAGWLPPPPNPPPPNPPPPAAGVDAAHCDAAISTGVGGAGVIGGGRCRRSGSAGACGTAALSSSASSLAPWGGIAALRALCTPLRMMVCSSAPGGSRRAAVMSSSTLSRKAWIVCRACSSSAAAARALLAGRALYGDGAPTCGDGAPPPKKPDAWECSERAAWKREVCVLRASVASTSSSCPSKGGRAPVATSRKAASSLVFVSSRSTCEGRGRAGDEARGAEGGEAGDEERGAEGRSIGGKGEAEGRGGTERRKDRGGRGSSAAEAGGEWRGASGGGRSERQSERREKGLSCEEGAAASSHVDERSHVGPSEDVGGARSARDGLVLERLVDLAADGVCAVQDGHAAQRSALRLQLEQARHHPVRLERGVAALAQLHLGTRRRRGEDLLVDAVRVGLNHRRRRIDDVLGGAVVLGERDVAHVGDVPANAEMTRRETERRAQRLSKERSRGGGGWGGRRRVRGVCVVCAWRVRGVCGWAQACVACACERRERPPAGLRGRSRSTDRRRPRR